MELTIKLFGPPAQAVGSGCVMVSLPAHSPTCAALRVALMEGRLELARLLPKCFFAVNHRYATEEQELRATDEIAIIGMVCGG